MTTAREVEAIPSEPPTPHKDEPPSSWFAYYAHKVARRDAIIAALEQQLSAANTFKEQVIECLIVDCIFEKAHETDARKAVHDLCAWEAKMALDPAISSDAAALRDTYLEQLSAARRESAAVRSMAVEQSRDIADPVERDKHPPPYDRGAWLASMLRKIHTLILESPATSGEGAGE